MHASIVSGAVSYPHLKLHLHIAILVIQFICLSQLGMHIIPILTFIIILRFSHSVWLCLSSSVCCWLSSSFASMILSLVWQTFCANGSKTMHKNVSNSNPYIHLWRITSGIYINASLLTYKHPEWMLVVVNWSCYKCA